MLYVVTGGTGFLGEHVVRELVHKRHHVRVIARSGFHPNSSDLHNNDLVTLIPASVLSPPADLAAHLANADGVFHLAGAVEHTRRAGEVEKMRQLHVTGTINVLEAANLAGVRRVVYASTSGVVAVSKDPAFVADDTASYAEKVVSAWPYYSTKLEAEKAALACAKRLGVELVVMRPTLLLGPGDWRLSSSRTVLDLLTGQVPLIPSGGLSLVDVRDAAVAFVEAMRSGRPDATYLLGAGNLTLADYFGRVPDEMAFAMAAAATGIKGLFGRWDPSLDPVVVEMSQHFWYCNASLARRDLTFKPRPVDETVADTVSWLQTNMAAPRVR
eukprot:jgi/Chlat1/5026/Chrsp32S08953